jgi:glycerol-3-phosphate acyltransferase PlsY
MHSFDLYTVICAVFGYLAGSIPFGLLLAGMGGAGDLREIGSGNIGATNVLRTGRKGLAAATLLLDLGKGLAAVLFARGFGPGYETIAGVAAVLGHCFPVWLGFRGGKGVATLMGVALGFAWLIGLIYAAVWLGVLALSRLSSLGGMAAAISAPVAAALLGYDSHVIALVLLAAVVLWQHRANIARLRAGTEPKLGGSKQP